MGLLRRRRTTPSVRDILNEAEAADALSGLPAVDSSRDLSVKVHGFGEEYWRDVERVAGEVAEAWGPHKSFELNGTKYRVDWAERAVQDDLEGAVTPDLFHEQELKDQFSATLPPSSINTLFVLHVDGVPLDRSFPIREKYLSEREKSLQLTDAARYEAAARKFNRDLTALLEGLITEAGEQVHNDFRRNARYIGNLMGVDFGSVEAKKPAFETRRGALRGAVKHALELCDQVDLDPESSASHVLEALAPLRDVVRVIVSLTNGLQSRSNWYEPDGPMPSLRFLGAHDMSDRFFGAVGLGCDIDWNSQLVGYLSERWHFESVDQFKELATDQAQTDTPVWLSGWSHTLIIKSFVKKWPEWVEGVAEDLKQLDRDLELPGPKTIEEARAEADRQHTTVENSIGQLRILRQLGDQNRAYINHVAQEIIDAVGRTANMRPFNVFVGKAVYHSTADGFSRNGCSVGRSMLADELMAFVSEGPQLVEQVAQHATRANDAIAYEEGHVAAMRELEMPQLSDSRYFDIGPM